MIPAAKERESHGIYSTCDRAIFHHPFSVVSFSGLSVTSGFQEQPNPSTTVITKIGLESSEFLVDRPVMMLAFFGASGDRYTPSSAIVSLSLAPGRQARLLVLYSVAPARHWAMS